ncbi:MAG TPA: DUF1801 domain-containing protein [Candidatus Dormibacteraeota bacterium]
MNPIDDHIEKVWPAVRSTVKAARRTVRTAAPKAEEIACSPKPPSSRAYMWKVLRYAAGGANVVGIGTFRDHSSLFFYRGRELDDGKGLLEGGGKEMRFIRLDEPKDAERPEVRAMLRKAFKLGGAPAGVSNRSRPLSPRRAP